MDDFKIKHYRDGQRPSDASRRLFSLVRSPLACLISVNVVVFLTLHLIGLFGIQNPAFYVALNGNIDFFLTHPWGLATYMFVQVDVLNLLFNMMWLWAFGAVMTRYENPRLLWPAYLVSGLAGGVCFLAGCAASKFSYGILTGSSAAVLGIIAAAATMRPRLKLNMVLFGRVELRWIAFVAIIICGIAPGIGNGPTLASHLGGILAGFVFVMVRRYRPSQTHAAKPGVVKRMMQVRQHEKAGLTATEQSELDRLLEKVSKSGYKSLSDSERLKLFDLSDKLKKR